MSDPISELLARFERDDGGLLAAQAAAFALVAASDGEVSPHESGRFVEFAIDQAGGSPAALAHDFGELAAAVANDLEAHGPRALAAVARVRGNRDHARRVGRAARMASVADATLRPGEEFVIHEIAGALGIDPDEL
jgi:tellurite resistance protein